MPRRFRRSGIPEIGDIAWGTHFCHFYETKQDLLDLLVPFVRAGLEDNEFCLWIVFNPLTIDGVRQIVAEQIPGGARYLASGGLEVHSHLDWFPGRPQVDFGAVLKRWNEKLAQALNAGFEGVRANGNDAWVSNMDWLAFARFEEHLNEVLKNQPALVACTYPLLTNTASRVFEVARSHHFVIAKRHGISEKLESPDLRLARRELELLSEELEGRIVERTLALSSTNELLRALSARIQSAKEEEAARIARELHDQMGSTLTSLRWRLEAIEEELQRPQAPGPTNVLAKIRQARAEADELAMTVRRIASHLRPPELSDLGLADAIDAESKDFQERTGITTNVKKSTVAPELDESQSIALFRIVQECLTNVQQHSRATSVNIRLQVDANQLTLSIVDNGKGIPQTAIASPKSLGIWSMRERAHLIGADLEIKGSDTGTTVIVRVPASDRKATEPN